MKLLLVTVFLSVAQTAPPIPRQAANSTNQSAQSAEKNADQYKQPIAPMPPGKQVVEQSTRQETPTNNPTTQNAEQTVRVRELPSVSVLRDWADWILWGASAVLALVGIVGICVAIKTLKALKTQSVIMRRQTRHIARQALSVRRQTTHLKNSVEASRDTAEAILKIERAWVDVKLEKLGPAVYRLRATNYGKTVARMKELKWTRAFAPDYGIPDSTKTFPRDKILAPNEPWTIIEINLVTELGQSIWGRINAYPNGVHFDYTGSLHYEDMADRPHITEFKVYHSAAGELAQLEAPQYNKHT